MAVSARTAPKSKGSDAIEIKVLGPDELEPLAVEMEEIAASSGMKFFLRDAGNIRQSGACVLIGADGLSTLGLNCGACGHATCAEMKASVDIAPVDSLYKGPVCALRSADLGIAVGSAVKTASILNVDNRIMDYVFCGDGGTGSGTVAAFDDCVWYSVVGDGEESIL